MLMYNISNVKNNGLTVEGPRKRFFLRILANFKAIDAKCITLVIFVLKMMKRRQSVYQLSYDIKKEIKSKGISLSENNKRCAICDWLANLLIVKSDWLTKLLIVKSDCLTNLLIVKSD